MLGTLLITGFGSMAPDEKAFFKAARRAHRRLRRKRGITQVQLAESWAHPADVASYEVGRRRVPVSILPALPALRLDLES